MVCITLFNTHSGAAALFVPLDNTIIYSIIEEVKIKDNLLEYLIGALENILIIIFLEKRFVFHCFLGDIIREH
jgi:hypothetical protein